MNEASRTPLVVAFVVVVVLFLIFGGWAMTGSMMSSGGAGMMGRGWTDGVGWVWIPTLLILVLGVVLGWLIFAKK
jgi:hypothetical protein